MRERAWAAAYAGSLGPFPHAPTQPQLPRGVLRYRTKAALLRSIQEEHEAFLALAASIPRSRYGEPGVWGDNWTIQDLFAHLTDWEQLFLGWYRLGLAGEVPPRPAPDYKWNQTPELNRALWLRHCGEPWKVVWSRFGRSYTQLLRRVTALTERQLLRPGAYPWTGKLPLASYLGPNSASHYRTARRILTRWLRRQHHHKDVSSSGTQRGLTTA